MRSAKKKKPDRLTSLITPASVNTNADVDPMSHTEERFSRKVEAAFKTSKGIPIKPKS